MTYTQTPIHQPTSGVDAIEVIDEINRVVYVFLPTTTVTAEQLVEDWATSGDPTWSITRPASDEDLASAAAALEASDIAHGS